jgi:hypothetical protein
MDFLYLIYCLFGKHREFGGLGYFVHLPAPFHGHFSLAGTYISIAPHVGVAVLVVGLGRASNP